MLASVENDSHLEPNATEPPPRTGASLAGIVAAPSVVAYPDNAAAVDYGKIYSSGFIVTSVTYVTVTV